MTHSDEQPDSDRPADRTDGRAELLPEEREFAVQDPEALARAVLAESDARTEDPDAGHSGTGTTGVTGDDPLVSDTD
ncbi:hypothetical protein ACXR2U_20900 [Jatrophihabitans sp. YIM 134969]